jgi:hypothetical protein
MQMPLFWHGGRKQQSIVRGKPKTGVSDPGYSLRVEIHGGLMSRNKPGLLIKAPACPPIRL